MIRLLLLVAMLLTGCAVTIRNDRGGMVIDYAVKVRRAESVKVDGWCASACTLYLAHSNICITPKARFGFHKPYGSTPRENEKAKAWMLAVYPQWVREWIAANGGLTTRLIVMPYSYSSQHLRTC